MNCGDADIAPAWLLAGLAWLAGVVGLARRLARRPGHRSAAVRNTLTRARLAVAAFSLARLACPGWSGMAGVAAAGVVLLA